MTLWRIIKSSWDMWKWIRASMKRIPMPLPTPSGAEHNYLTAQDIERIKAHRLEYRAAAAIVGGLHWLMLVPIHYRESGLRDKGPESWGGPFCLDASDLNGDHRRNREDVEVHCREVAKRYKLKYYDLDESFGFACVVAADMLKAKARWPLLNNDWRVDMDALADAYWAYNGRSSWHSPDGSKDATRASYAYSPYVSNDPATKPPLRTRGTIPAPTPEDPEARQWIDTEDQNPGAIVLFRELVRRESELMA